MSAAHPLDQLSAYLDGELSASARAQVDAHLVGCSACGAQLAELAAVDALARETEVEAPAGYFEALPGRIRARVAPRRRVSVPGWAMLVAASLLLAVVTPLVLLQRSTMAPATAPVQKDEAPPVFSQAPAEEPAATRDSRAKAPAATLPAAPLQAPATAAPGAGADAGFVDALAKREQVPERRRDADAVRQQAPAVARNEDTFAVPPQDAARPHPVAPGVGGRAAVEEDKKQKEREGQKPEAQPAAPRPPEMAEAVEVAPAPAAASAPRENDGEAYDRSAAKAVGGVAGTPQAKSGLTATGDIQRRALARQVPRTADDARKLRGEWRRVGAESGPASDEARVRAIEMVGEAFRMSKDPADQELLNADARAYLARQDAAQKERVRALLKRLGASPTPR